jgi:hypothetical protein
MEASIRQDLQIKPPTDVANLAMTARIACVEYGRMGAM